MIKNQFNQLLHKNRFMCVCAGPTTTMLRWSGVVLVGGGGRGEVGVIDGNETP